MSSLSSWLKRNNRAIVLLTILIILIILIIIAYSFLTITFWTTVNAIITYLATNFWTTVNAIITYLATTFWTTVNAIITFLKTFGVNDWKDVASIVTIIGIILGVFYYLSTIKWNFYRYLADLYYEILKKGFDHPEFCDPEKTRKYEITWPYDPQKYQYEVFARECWAYLEDIYDTASKSRLLLSRKEIIKIYAPTFERVKIIHGTWLENNRSAFPMKGFLEFIDSNKWRDYLDPSTSELFKWNSIAYDYYKKILSPLQVKRNNPLLQYIGGIKDQELIVADVGCGTGLFISNYLVRNNRFKKIYGIDYSDDMIKRAADRCARFNKVEFLKINIKNLKPLREKLGQNKPDLIFSINSLTPENPDDLDQMLCQIALTLKPKGKFIAVLPSFDTVEYLRTLVLEKFKKERAEYSQICYKNLCFKKKILFKLEGFYEFCKLLYYLVKFSRSMKFGTWKHMISLDRNKFGALLDTWKFFYQDRKMNDNKKLYADDCVNVQRFIHKNDIESLFKKLGLKLLYPPQEIRYPWDLAEKFGYGFFPNRKEIWDWFVVAEKSER